MDDRSKHEFFELLEELRVQVRDNRNNHQTLITTLREFKTRYEADRKEDEDIRLLFSRLRAVGRVGSFIRSAVGWIVLVGGSSILIFEYVLSRFK